MTDEYRLFIRYNAITAEQALFDLRNALQGTGIENLEVWSHMVEDMRVTTGNLARILERMGRDEKE